MMRVKTFIGFLVLLLATSCENEPYSSGDGALSNMTTVFGEADFDSQGCAVRFDTDADKTLNFTRPYGKPDEKLANKTLRSLLYYNITDDAGIADPVMIAGVLTANVIDRDSIKNKKDDPLKVHSVWLSENKKYLNLALSLKTSTPEDESLRHKLGMLYESTQGEVSNLRLIHDDADIPGNYSVKTYFSVPVKSIIKRNPQCTKIIVGANTFDGTKTFELEMN